MLSLHPSLRYKHLLQHFVRLYRRGLPLGTSRHRERDRSGLQSAHGHRVGLCGFVWQHCYSCAALRVCSFIRWLGFDRSCVSL